MEQAVNVNFRLDAAVKKNMEQVCAELGLSMSAAFTIFAKKVGRERRIPFDVSIDPFYQIERKAPAFRHGDISELPAKTSHGYWPEGQGAVCCNKGKGG